MHEIVQDYYGRRLKGSADLKTSACCDVSQVPEWLKPLHARIQSDVQARFVATPSLLAAERDPL
jgi:arsenite methyltransferase